MTTNGPRDAIKIGFKDDLETGEVTIQATLTFVASKVISPIAFLAVKDEDRAKFQTDMVEGIKDDLMGMIASIPHTDRKARPELTITDEIPDQNGTSESSTGN